MPHHLAQLNVATPRFPLDDSRMADFMNALDEVNALAEASPGFVWRLIGDDGDNATDLSHPALDGMIVNMSVWADRESLWNYVYRSDHTAFLRRRAEWFERAGDAVVVLWWVAAGHLPSLDEAVDRLDLLRAKGATADAFTFREFHAVPVSGSSA
ncbi:MAG TPA: DUF3291 domain-containing protein [Ilumatobacter sp.]|nr:DUF3291 domain-containing protein [Ilumatobacter sp.]